MRKWLWDLSFRLGFEEIDKQHKQLFIIANELMSNDNSFSTFDRVKNTLQKLKEYVDTHFKDEEMMMSKYNYPLVEEHKKIHSDIVTEIKNTIKKFHDVKELKTNLENLLSAWIRDHILLEDMRFSEWAKVNKII